MDCTLIVVIPSERKSKKSGKNTSGSALHTQKAILYAKARQRAFDAVKEGHAYLCVSRHHLLITRSRFLMLCSDRALDQMGQLKHQEGAYRKHVQDFSPLYNASDVCAFCFADPVASSLSTGLRCAGVCTVPARAVSLSAAGPEPPTDRGTG